MNPFPETILSPTTAHRLPVSLNEKLIERLWELEVNASAFLMDDADLKRWNDAEKAKRDLIAQLPILVLETLFPPPPKPIVFRPVPPAPPAAVSEEDGDEDGSGMGAGLGMGMGMGMGMSLGRRISHERPREGRGYSM